MTEFETATLAYQQAMLAYQQTMLAYQQTSLDYQYVGMWAAIAGPVVALVVGAGQCGLLWYGIRQMTQINTDRAKREAVILESLEAQNEGAFGEP